LSRSLTVALPSPARVAKAVVAIAAAVLIVIVGLRIGGSLLGPAAAKALSAGGALQEIHTTQGLYVGQVVAEDESYISLRTPAVVREEQATDGGTPSGRILVILLASEPYYVAGDVVLPRNQVVLVGNVTPGSPLDTAYRQATGELPAPSATPSSAP
jgi:hypothetical protein